MINNAHVGRILPETNHHGWNHSESSINWSPSSTSVCIEEGYSFLTRTSRVGSDRISGECWRMFKEYLLTFEMNIGGKCKGNHSSTMEHLGCIYWMILFWLFWLFWLFMIFDSENGTTSWTMHSLWWCFSLTHPINSWISRWETNFLTIDRWCCSPWCGNIMGTWCISLPGCHSLEKKSVVSLDVIPASRPGSCTAPKVQATRRIQIAI